MPAQSSSGRVARESLFGFTAALAQRTSDSINIQIQESQQSFTIPTKALELLSFILSNMAEGKAISLVPSDAELTTQQAANMLNVSRPHIVKLLEEGVIPFKKVGSHHRILLNDLLMKLSTKQTGKRTCGFWLSKPKTSTWATNDPFA